MSEPRSQLSFEIKPDSEPSAPSLNPSQISQTKNTPSCTKRSVDSRRSSVRAPLSTHFPQLSLASYDEGGHSSKSAGKGKKTISLRRIQIRPRGERQQHYISQIQNSSLVFGVGPAGTGKTFLAVACAVEALESDRVERLILVRPAVEAGERLGFLPGDMAQKVDPYLRPIYDALYHMMGFERVTRLMEKSVIDVAPLAYMRGRTLNNAFVILDEAQNTTRLQMKMFLTRLGFGSTAVVTGDVTQVDLPMRETSGLSDAIRLLTDVKGVGFTFFQRDDVVRHPLVSRIIEAYEDDESE
jgi:phosphate starvation-inducible PhoH-like protein